MNTEMVKASALDRVEEFYEAQRSLANHINALVECYEQRIKDLEAEIETLKNQRP